ncbi:Panacea domain-containing protein [Robbsia andropogonis]|uniref:Panacea domain-containing protein n=1 Tax=Robbsia andropogonis TaxID=28092 RepID=UPI00209F0750|nr:type II toxin-antitoxin system antitoxin SocA domain-containing protein [Robbsia andropogonis]MCP1120510.1 DUF4065 domain-containing protein [Robbsia andropogonis]MCP1131291.1 DUF4065 domain-containing protein [Robbsia andropogonis]
MPYDARAIANFFIDLGLASGQAIDPMKLQKLVYYAVGWYAGYTGQPLIDEQIEAWPYGPVVPSIYHSFKGYGSSPIQRRLESVPPILEADICGFLNNVWQSYRDYSPLQLSSFSHEPGGPWDLARKQNPGMRSVGIDFSLIQDRFRAAVERMQNK